MGGEGFSGFLDRNSKARSGKRTRHLWWWIFCGTLVLTFESVDEFLNCDYSGSHRSSVFSVVSIAPECLYCFCFVHNLSSIRR